MPVIDDSRVRFFKGWFDQVLPSYAAPARDVAIFKMDADLYSSTLYVLRELKPLIRAGTYLYFDEFRVDQQEFRAFRDFVAETGQRFRVVGSTRDFNQIALQCTA